MQEQEDARTAQDNYVRAHEQQLLSLLIYTFATFATLPVAKDEKKLSMRGTRAG